jgi:thioredoxin reductase (NADPH)
MTQDTADSPDLPLDVVIVGGGPVGLACGIAARRAGMRCLVIEKGCLVNSVFEFPSHMVFFTTPELMEIGDHPLVCVREKPTRAEALDYYRSVARVEKLSIGTYETVTRIDGEKDAFRVSTESRDGSREHVTRHVVLATGYYDHPNFLGIPGEDLPHVSHYYSEPHPFAGRRVLVVGAKNSACEAALDLFRHDADVTLVHRGSELGKTVKYWVRPDVENRIAAGEIRAYFDTLITEIRDRSVILTPVDGGEPREESYDQVFLLTGYHPDDELLRNCGLRPDPETLKVERDPETLESRDVPGIYLAGSVSAGYEIGNIFIENGRFDAQRIVDVLRG